MWIDYTVFTIVSDPVCTVANSQPIAGDNVTLTCDVTYTSNISPMLMTWTDSQGQPVQSHTDQSQTGRTTSSIVVTAVAPRLPSYRCTTGFSTATGLPSTATNTPEYRHVWNSPEVNIEGTIKI